jgi:hypothetical protein
MANYNTSTPYWSIKFIVVLLGILGFYAYSEWQHNKFEVPPAIYFAAILLALAGGAAAAESNSPDADSNKPIVMYVKT